MSAQLEQAPLACTLGGGELRARLDRIARLGREHLVAQWQEGPALHLSYAQEAAAELRAIVALERECCAFLAFEMVERGKVVDLAITAPSEAGEFASELFEHFSTGQPRCAAACGCRTATPPGG